MKKSISKILLAAACLCGACAAPATALAQSNASMSLSALPLASVVVSAAAGGAAAAAASTVPAALSVAGSQLVIKGVQASADGVVYLLERVSDGAQASVRVSLGGAHYSVKQIDTAVSVMVIASGVVLVAAGEVLAFVPNEIGRALLSHRQLSN